MSAHCCSNNQADAGPRYRRILWIALAVNAPMFVLELGASFSSGSTALAADAADFAGDAANYALSLAAIAAGGLWQSRAALVKGYAMGIYGVAVLAYAAWRMWLGAAPEPLAMGLVGTAAFAANLGVAVLLFAYREGNANMRSVWLCTRNDAIGNIAVVVASAGVYGTGSLWPDVAVAILMAGLGLRAAYQVVGQSRAEIRDANTSAATIR